MIVKRKELRDWLEAKLNTVIESYPSDLQKISNEIRRKHNIPDSVIMPYLTLRRPLDEANEFILFVILENTMEEALEDYFSEAQIREYTNFQFEKQRIKFPLEYDMVQISDDQWIGSISSHDLAKLSEAQLINYNENTQRPLRRIANGDQTYYKIWINKTAVRKIVDLMKRDMFIPNTLTFNIPEGTKLYYNNGKLVIEELDHFDIIDGYHRYLALCKILANDPNFDYTFELRIVRFSTDDAERFIWQEDQKNRIRKVDLDAIDVDDPSNKIVKALNRNIENPYQGKITRNGGIINATLLAKAIKLIYFNNKRGKDDYANEVKIRENLLINLSNAYFILSDKKEWSSNFILCFVYAAKNELNVEVAIQMEKLLEGMDLLAGEVSLRTVNTLDGLANKATGRS